MTERAAGRESDCPQGVRKPAHRRVLAGPRTPLNRVVEAEVRAGWSSWVQDLVAQRSKCLRRVLVGTGGADARERSADGRGARDRMRTPALRSAALTVWLLTPKFLLTCAADQPSAYRRAASRISAGCNPRRCGPVTPCRSRWATTVVRRMPNCSASSRAVEPAVYSATSSAGRNRRRRCCHRRPRRLDAPLTAPTDRHACHASRVAEVKVQLSEAMQRAARV
jgi:hypothetical protein